MNFFTGLSNWSETSNRFDVGGNHSERVSIELERKNQFLLLIFYKLSDFIISTSLFICRQLMAVN